MEMTETYEHAKVLRDELNTLVEEYAIRVNRVTTLESNQQKTTDDLLHCRAQVREMKQQMETWISHMIGR